jgi:diguanylate cyclase (GGDEF)-like protein/PAS domain S-box-containing protein
MNTHALLKSVYARMFLIICAATIPVLAGSGYALYRHARAVQQSTRDEASRYLEVAAEYTRAEIAGASETLDAMSAAPSMRGGDWAQCQRYLAAVLALRAQRYENFGVIGLNGNVQCSAVNRSGHGPLYLGDRGYFRRALQHDGAVLGRYQLGRLTGEPVLVVAMALPGADGRPATVLFAALRLSALAHVERETDGDSGITVVDRHGTILFSSNASLGRVGDTITAPLVRRAIAHPTRTVQFVAPPGSPLHLLGSASAGLPGDPDAAIVLFTSRGERMLAGLYRDLWAGALITLLLAALALGAGWTATHAVLGRDIRRLADAAARLRQRRFDTRVASEVSAREFRLIAVQLDEMAGELAQREQDWRLSLQRQSRQVDVLRRIAQNEPLAQVLTRLCEFAQQQIPDAIASVMIVDGRGESVVECIAPQLPATYRDALTGARAEPGAGSCGTAIAERRIVVTEDIAHDPLWRDYRAYALPHGLHACWSHPIVSAGSRVLGSFALYFPAPRKAAAGELQIGQMGAELAAVAIDRHQTGEALQQSEAEYRAMFESNPYPMWVCDTASGAFLAVNDAAIAHYGYSRDAFLRRHEADLDMGAAAPGTYAREAGLASGTHARLHRDAKGGVLQVEVAYFPLRFQGRDASLALISDVTYRRSLTNTIREQHALFELLMESTVEAIGGFDRHGRCTFANAACERLLGYRASELVGRELRALVASGGYADQAGPANPAGHAGRLAPHAGGLPGALAPGAHAHVEDGVFRRKDGTLLPVEYWVYPIVREGATAGSIVTFLDTTERRRQQEELRRRATYDALTGLLNRASFVAALDACLARPNAPERVAVGLLDLDGFKEINDSLGHEAGDQLLRDVGERLRSALGNVAEIGRLGGDEFAFVLQAPQQEAIVALVEATLDALRRPFAIAGLDLQIGATIGAACFPGAGHDVKTLLRSADAAMYAARREGRRFDVTDRVDYGNPRPFLMSELRHALDGREFVLHFQPTVPLQDKTRIGFEALLRWDHPGIGLVSPGEFMPLLELSDLIHPLTDWVIESAVAHFAPVLGEYDELFVSVNISTRNLLDLQFAERVRRVLSRHRFAPHQLKLEVTESAVMSDPERALKALTELHRLGVRIAIDDFGTGYSSLSYLQKLPVDDLKIDRSFVIGMAFSDASTTIVQSIISLAHSLGISVTAEGIETEDTLNRLRAAGCDYAQGFYIAHPMPFEALRDWLTRSPWFIGRPLRWRAASVT